MPGSGVCRFRSAQRSRGRRWSLDEARAVLRRLDVSGLAVADFAAQEGLDPKRLYRWRAQLRAAPVSFVEIPRAPAACWPIELVLRSGRILRMANGFEQETLRRLIQALEEGPGC
jgi:Transposase